ncbi:shikimate kinase [Desulfococcus sp.]|jgi:shikimate kinase|uniref:shikimate kinase n=1 Tax=Desulfococcus sp. TaxID=2025834 RepID=UPI003593D97E
MARANIILTGFMGTGKSTVGKLVAKALGYGFVDTDELIQARCGQTVPEIFRERGEAAFRDMEAEIARELGAKEGLVVSTGGRLMLDPGNARALGGTGRVFCLRATPEEILARVTGDSGVARPLLQTENPLERVVELMRQREPGYARFTQLETTGIPPEEAARRLLDIYRS